MDDSKSETQLAPSRPLPKHEQDALAFRQSVKRLREAKGWTQNHLAERLREAGLEEFHQITVARLETGRRAVRLGEAGVIASVLGSTVQAMLRLSKENKLELESNKQIDRLKKSWDNFVEATLQHLELSKGFLNDRPLGLTKEESDELYEIKSNKAEEWSKYNFWEGLEKAYWEYLYKRYDHNPEPLEFRNAEDEISSSLGIRKNYEFQPERDLFCLGMNEEGKAFVNLMTKFQKEHPDFFPNAHKWEEDES